MAVRGISDRFLGRHLCRDRGFCFFSVWRGETNMRSCHYLCAFVDCRGDRLIDFRTDVADGENA
jgi:hypothetical protein